MTRLDQRIKRIEKLMGGISEPVTFKLIFFGKSDWMPKESYRCGNVIFEPVLYQDFLLDGHSKSGQ